MKKNPLVQFEEHFATVYGERWPALRAALTTEAKKVQLTNPFGLAEYALDPASLYPVEALDLKPGQVVADFCSSPGGKSLAGIFALRGQADWHCNDLSPARVARLKAILHDCVPPEIMARIKISTGDASRWGMRYPEQFDRILLDAPCSGERHLLHSAKELGRWSLKGSKRLSMRQHALLCAAVDALKPGGRLVYSTCSISPIENDTVIQKLFNSRPGQVQLAELALSTGEATQFGRIFLPDAAYGGPIYLCALAKILN